MSEQIKSPEQVNAGLDKLKKIADSRFGGIESDRFKQYVETSQWAGSYDKIKFAYNNQNQKPETHMGILGNTYSDEQVNAGQQVQQWDVVNGIVIPKTQQPKTQQPTTPSQPTTPVQPIQTTPQEPTAPVETPKATTTTPTTIETPAVDKDKQISTDITKPDWQNKIDQALEKGSSEEVMKRIEAGKSQMSPEQYQEITGYLGAKNVGVTPTQTSDEIFTMLQSGQTPQDKTLVEYQEAFKRFQRLTKYDGMTPSDISYAMQTGDLVKGSQAYNDLKMKNPELIWQAEASAAISNIYGETTSAEDFMIKISQNILDGFTGDVNNYKAVLSENPRVVELRANMTESKKEIDEMKDSIDNVYKDLEKQFAGTGATRSYLQAKASRQTEDLVRTYNLKLNEYNTMAGELSNITEDVKYEMGLKQQQEAKKMDVMQFLYGVGKDELNYERSIEAEKRQQGYVTEERKYQSEQKQKELKQKFDLEYGDINSEDPRVQRVAFERMAQAVHDQYKWMPFRRDVSTMASDIMNEYKNGRSIKDITTDITNAVQNSPAYTNWATGKGLMNETTASGGTTTPSWVDISTYYNNYGVSQDYGANSPNSKDNVPLLNGKTGTPWIDFKMPVGSEVYATTGGTVVTALSSKDYGMQIAIKDDNGNVHMYSHLSNANFKVGDKVTPGQSIANSGNSGFSTGPHLDYRVKDSSGKWTDPKQFLQAKTPDITKTDITVFNSLTPTAKAKMQSDPLYKSFIEKQSDFFSDPDAKIEDILTYSAGWDNVWETSTQQLSKFNQALSQVKNLKESISSETTWPITWTLRSWNPYDSNAQALKAELNSLIPNIARWVYGEVGVLTDTDIELYKKTLSNIKSTKDTNDLVLAMTLKTMINGYKWQLQTLAGVGKDVSKMQGKYKEYEATINSLLNNIWKSSSSTQNKSNTVTSKSGNVYKY